MITKAKARTKTLLVDDELDIIFSLKLFLEENGFEVDAYNDPSLAITNFKPGLYDLIILDIKMPQLNGFELYKTIRELDNNVKVFFLTAVSDFSGYEEVLKKMSSTLAENCFIQKPVDTQELLRRVSI
jgi:two-component system, OmpR family, response regulator ChvI